VVRLRLDVPPQFVHPNLTQSASAIRRLTPTPGFLWQPAFKAKE
jgi:hypothetical protein